MNPDKLMRNVIETMIERAAAEFRATGATESETQAFVAGYCAGMQANPLQAHEDVWQEAVRKSKK